jgi:hypothetical protein
MDYKNNEEAKVKSISSFKREYKKFDLQKFKNEEIFNLIENDISCGNIFPALRANEIHFYYEGGRIFTFNGGKFSYNTEYHKYMIGEYGESKNNFLINRPFELTLKQFYEDIKIGVYERHRRSNKGESNERQFLAELYKSTYTKDTYRKTTSDTKVLDIEMRFNKGNDEKKCDLVLYNNKLQKLMLVEAKLVDNPEIKSRSDYPKVIQQVNRYTSWLDDENLLKEQYSSNIEFINTLFNTAFNKEIKDICKSAKLIVFKTNIQKELKQEHKTKLVDRLGMENVLFYSVDDIKNINIDEIWNGLDK